MGHQEEGGDHVDGDHVDDDHVDGDIFHVMQSHKKRKLSG